MKSKEMLKAIGNIDEKYISDAEVKSDNKEVKKSSTNFIRWAGGIAAVLVLCVVGGSILFSFSGAGVKSDSAYYDGEANIAYDYSGNSGFKAEAQLPSLEVAESFIAADSKGITKSKSNSSSNSLSQKNVKLIYTANISLQTTEYDETINSIKSLVSEFDGYFEGSNEYNGGMFTNNYKNGDYTIRVPQERYSSFVNTVGNSGYVVSLSENVQDIGEQYYETESRIETLKIKQDRLQELLKSASNMSDIITLESELSNVEYELENYTTRLNHYDSLVGYSTVYLHIEEVGAYKDAPVQKESFGTRFVRAIKSGFVNAADNLIDLGIWIGYNLIGIIIFAVIVFLIWKFHLIKRLIRKITGKQ